MSDLFSVVEISAADADKIRRHLDAIKQTQANTSDALEAINSATNEFNQFFSQYGEPYFTANQLKRNDTPRSEVYNENIATLGEDINRAYISLSSASSTTLNAFNFATIVSQEITNSADQAASKVLDLNILNGYTKGQVIVAGDDFSDTSKIDSSAALETAQAKPIQGAKSYGLNVIDSVSIVSPDIKVSITPIKPVGQNGKVNTDPTPLNLERFYEGKFYAFIGQQQPEGDSLSFKYIVDPKAIPASASKVTVDGKVVQDDLSQVQQSTNFFAVVPTSDTDKAKARAKMFDGNPDTYWQCEYVFQTEPLIDPYSNLSTDFEKTNSTADEATSVGTVLEGSQVVIDLKAAEEIAKQFDYNGRDLQVNIDIDFGSITPINYVLINPVVPGTSSFIKVLDVATADASSDFTTVDGFDSQAFDKILTPEANKVLSSDVQAKSMAPTAYSYAGLGVFSFPVRFASRLRITLLAEDPVPAPYERMHVMLQETSTLTTKVSSKKKTI